MEIIRSLQMVGATEDEINRIPKGVLDWMESFLTPSRIFLNSKYKVKGIIKILKKEENADRQKALVLLIRLWRAKNRKEKKKRRANILENPMRKLEVKNEILKENIELNPNNKENQVRGELGLSSEIDIINDSLKGKNESVEKARTSSPPKINKKEIKKGPQ